MRTTAAICFTLGCLVAVPATSEDLTIGHVRLALGMPQKQALDELSKEFDPKQVSVVEGKYLLWSRHLGYLSSAGSVSFRDGKLYRASKTWGEDPRPMGARDVTDGLVGVLSEIAGKGWRVGRVRAEILRAPGRDGISGSVVKLVTLELPPDRRIYIQVNEPLTVANGVAFDRGITVEEVLVEPPKSP